jgi:hypothetical protein
MAGTPRADIANDAFEGLHCAICGEDTLRVVHVDRLPDYVECVECKSAFITEAGGDRVLYGQIAEGYPQTSQFALKQWAWIEAVETRAREERPPQAEEVSPTSETIPTEDLPAGPPEAAETAEPAAEKPDEERWTVLEEFEAADEPPAVDLQAPAEESAGEPARALEEAQAPEEQPADFQDEGELFSEITEESYEAEGELGDLGDSEVPTDQEEQPAVEGSEELPGFAWLGGLADEDSMLEAPDLGVPEETGAPEDTPAAAAEDEQGLSAGELDDLFKADSDEEISSPAFSEQLKETPEWQAQEPEFEPQPPDEEGPSSSWLDEIEIEEQQPEEPAASMEFEGSLAGSSEPDEESGWEDAELEYEGEDAEEEQPPEAWLQDQPKEDLEEPEPEAGGYEWSESGLSFTEDESDGDFLSSLRDSAAIPLESQPLEDQALQGQDFETEEPSPPSWAIEGDEEDAGAMAARMQSVTSSESEAAPESELDEALSDASVEVEEEPIQEDVIHYRETDPPRGFRHRVVIGGDRVVFPGGECVHCGRTPVKGQLAIAGTLPEGQGMGARKPTRFQVPLCNECRQRATRLSDDAKSARQQSWLFALIIGLAFVVGSLAFGLVKPAEMAIADWFILLFLFIIGFAGSALLLLNRVSNYPPPMDAAYIRTTLLIPSENQGLETAFEWRNPEYAQRFYEANESNALGSVTRVKDRLVLGGD